MRILIFGPPGVGKGTQSALLKRNLSRIENKNTAHISTGEILRFVVREKTELGRKSEQYMNQGELLPDTLMCKIVEERLSKEDCKDGFILDGFPRTLPQAGLLNDLLEKLKCPLDSVLHLACQEKILVDRILQRSQKESRKDDNLKTIFHRIEIYKKETLSLIPYYSEKEILRPSVPAIGPVEEIEHRILHSLGILLPSKTGFYSQESKT